MPHSLLSSLKISNIIYPTSSIITRELFTIEHIQVMYTGYITAHKLIPKYKRYVRINQPNRVCCTATIMDLA